MRWAVPVGAVAAALLASGVARAHVRYVTGANSAAGDIVAFVASVLAAPANAALVGVGAAGVLAALGAYHRWRPAHRDIAALRSALAEYEPYVPWMLRLSLGLPLLGAGFAGYLAGLVTTPAFLLAGEFVGGFVAILLLGAGRPSADHLLQRVANAERTLYGRVDPAIGSRLGSTPPWNPTSGTPRSLSG